MSDELRVLWSVMALNVEMLGLFIFSEFDNCVFVFVLLNMYILQRIWNP